MKGKHEVPIVNKTRTEVTFERQTARSTTEGTIKIKPGESYYERGVNLTFQTLVLMDSSGNSTGIMINVDDLADDSLEMFEVKFENDTFKLVPRKLVRGSWLSFFGSSGGTLPT